METTSNTTLPLIDQALQNTEPVKLVRTAGSYIAELINSPEQETVKFLSSLDFFEVTEQVREVGAGFGLCRYFKAAIPQGYNGFTAAETFTKLFEAKTGTNVDTWSKMEEGPKRQKLADAMAEILSQVEMRVGPHGPELNLKGNGASTSFVTLIVGNSKKHDLDPVDSPLVYTWFPGEPTKPVKFSELTVKFV